MALKDQLGKVTGLAVDAVKIPAAVAGTAVGLAKGAAGTVKSVVAGNEPSVPPAPTDVEPAAEEPEVTINPDEPVNVTEQLGLDPAPVAKPKPRKKAAPKPVTSIDAGADATEVDVTPADVAKVIDGE